jgi:hypothetical protein
MAVTTDQVKALLVEPPTDVQIFLDTANTLATAYLTGKGLSANIYDACVLYLAAHFAVISIERGGMARSKIGASEEEYHVITSDVVALKATRFGQQAIMFDSSGTLANLSSKGLPAEFKVIKTPQDGRRLPAFPYWQ